MFKQLPRSPFFTRKRVRTAAILLAGVLTVGVFTGSATNRTTYIITDGDVITTVEGYAGEVDAALRRGGIALAPTDRVVSHREGDVSQVSIAHGQKVTVKWDGSATTLLNYEGTVSELLNRLHITLGAADKVSEELSALVSDGMTVVVDRRMVVFQESGSPIPYETIRQENPDLYRGEERVLQAGTEGVLNRNSRLVLAMDGTTVETTDLGESVYRAAVPQIVEYGTRLKAVSASSLSITSNVLTNVTGDSSTGGVLTTANGQELRYSRAIDSVATAYTTERQAWKRTATGTTARVGAIAVDPRVIPYGTEMYIVSADGSITYGVATAEDCGSGVKGNRIDLFFDTYNACINFGVRNCIVYILD